PLSLLAINRLDADRNRPHIHLLQHIPNGPELRIVTRHIPAKIHDKLELNQQAVHFFTGKCVRNLLEPLIPLPLALKIQQETLPWGRIKLNGQLETDAKFRLSHLGNGQAHGDQAAGVALAGAIEAEPQAAYRDHLMLLAAVPDLLKR